MINEWWQTILTLISGIGIGAIISSWITIHYQKKKLMFETKLIKYSNLIQAYQDAVANPSEAKRQNYVSHQKQVELIGTDEVITLSQEFYNQHNEDHSSHLTRDKLVTIMRKDLRKHY